MVRPENMHCAYVCMQSQFKNDIMKFTGKWGELENVNLIEITQSQKNPLCMYSLIHGYCEALSRRKGPNVDASISLKRGKKIHMRG